MPLTVTMTIQGSHDEVRGQIALFHSALNSPPALVMMPAGAAGSATDDKTTQPGPVDPKGPDGAGAEPVNLQPATLKKRGRGRPKKPEADVAEPVVETPSAPEPTSTAELASQIELPEFLNRNKKAAPKPEVSAEDARGAFQKLNETKGIGFCIGFIGKFGVDRISKLPAERFAEFVGAVEKEVGE